jgi:hypothetical protein
MLKKHRQQTGNSLKNRRYAERSRSFSMGLDARGDAGCSAIPTRAEDTVGQIATHARRQPRKLLRSATLAQGRRISLSTSCLLRSDHLCGALYVVPACIHRRLRSSRTVLYLEEEAHADGCAEAWSSSTRSSAVGH